MYCILYYTVNQYGYIRNVIFLSLLFEILIQNIQCHCRSGKVVSDIWTQLYLNGSRLAHPDQCAVKVEIAQTHCSFQSQQRFSFVVITAIIIIILALLQDCQMTFYECSACSGHNVMESMVHLAR